MDLSLSEKGIDEKNLENFLFQVIEHSPDTASVGYLNYLYSSPDPIGLIGDWLKTLINTNVHAYEASPVFTLIEIELIKALAKTVGYEAKSDGIFCPGASYCNMVAMYLARKRFNLESTYNNRLAVFTSEQSHTIPLTELRLFWESKNVWFTKLNAIKKGECFLMI
jgi:glutamate/tyrosine decarboxylase-like PLP-dependent enzyme